MKYEVITSRNNQHIKNAAKLTACAKFRKQTGLFVLDGLRLCTDAVLTNTKIVTAFFTAEAMRKNEQELTNIISAADKAYETDPEVMRKVSDTVSPQGVICVCCADYFDKNISAIDKNGRYVICENLSNPLNLGAISRSAEALGADGLILTGSGCDMYNPKAQRAAMGSLLRLPVYSCEDTEQTLNLLKSKEITLYASVVDSTACRLTDVVFRDGSAVVIGNEGSGLTDKTVKTCDYKITIPIKGRAESFNAAAAAAIIMWELLK